jgi:hypothetical protein
MANAGFLKEDIPLLCAVKGRTFQDDLNGLDLSSGDYRLFPAVLRRSGKILLNEQAYPYPTRAARAVRQIVEGRTDWPREYTGGWLYWHFQDLRTGRWERLDKLRDEFQGKQQGA